MRRGYVATLPSGIELEIVECGVGEVLAANRAAGAKAGMAGGMAAAHALARYAIRKIGGRAVTYTDLVAWPLSARDTMAALELVGRVHGPPDGAEKARDGGVVTTEDGRETWQLTLPSGRVAVLREASGYTLMHDILPASDAESGAPQAGEYRVGLEGLRRCLASLDGAAPSWGPRWIEEWPLSAPETALLVGIWRDMHGLGATSSTPTLVPTTA